jgi:hypothetical protein
MTWRMAILSVVEFVLNRFGKHSNLAGLKRKMSKNDYVQNKGNRSFVLHKRH